MARTMKCDICNKTYELYNTKNDPDRPNGVQLFSSRYVDGTSAHWYHVMDCCPKCMVNIQNHIEYLKLVAREEEK